MSFSRKAKTAIDLIRHARFGVALDGIKSQMYSDTRAFGLRRDLTKPFQAPSAKIPITIRRLTEKDVQSFRYDTDQDVTQAGVYQRTSRIGLMERGIGAGYAAVDSEDRIGYVQWMFLPRDNEALQSFFEGVFPPLAPGYALLEGAFTFEAFRGLGIMSSAMALIAKKAADEGVRYVTTFVTVDNIPSMKGCERAGFSPYCVRTERHRFFTLNVDFANIAEPMARGDAAGHTVGQGVA